MGGCCGQGGHPALSQFLTVCHTGRPRQGGELGIAYSLRTVLGLLVNSWEERGGVQHCGCVLGCGKCWVCVEEGIGSWNCCRAHVSLGRGDQVVNSHANSMWGVA